MTRHPQCLGHFRKVFAVLYVRLRDIAHSSLPIQFLARKQVEIVPLQLL
jgi:hypothetical protein